ncbi:DcrB-related protein [Merismopedia glauca]|uniref:Uncharacterized protein n=1 Tax=Merismopedia glauca CCAP 1448/3 TaxID=1296344 RepID=A0A2T1BX81_9CYAN|nr:DcrB-related protein [Merismopedia glauca]PSB00619.1 hypothetical protein C7B64_22590 [Merismopedia glauca CCAP 1448/3]
MLRCYGTGSVCASADDSKNSSSPTDTLNQEIIINSETLSKPLLLEEYSRELINRIKQRVSNFQLLEKCDTDIKLTGSPTQTICYQAQENGANIKYLLAVSLHVDRAYYLIYRSELSQYDRSLNSAKNVFRSFQIVEP